jgi:23S rRNA pseudouridine2605 synthase
MAEVRLQKFLAECGVGSRRKMEQFITEGRVRVNQQVVTDLGRKIDPEKDRVEVNRKPVHAAPKGILVFNKPRGVVSTLSDPEGRRSVADFLTKKYASYFPVGRLDWDSTGLMVLTNDGDIAERLMHPRYGFERVYHARVEGSVGDVVLGKIARGVRLSDGMVQARASIVSNDDNTTWVEISLAEGRNRVVRRLFEKLGHPVVKLKRTIYGPFKLGRLQVGQVRALTQKEYEQARRKVMTFKPEEAQSQTERPLREVSEAAREERPSHYRQGAPGDRRNDRRRARPDRRDDKREGVTRRRSSSGRDVERGYSESRGERGARAWQQRDGQSYGNRGRFARLRKRPAGSATRERRGKSDRSRGRS